VRLRRLAEAVERRTPGLAAWAPRRRDLRPLALYLAAGALYVAIGVLETDFLFSWFSGAVFLLVVVWLIPAAIRRLR